jgi:tol-pal system protein YbgF
MKPSRRSPLARFLALSLAALSFAACATKGDLRNVTTEIRALSARQDSLLVALRQQAMVTQDSLRGTTNQLFEIRGTVNQQLARIQDELAIVRQENAQFAQLLASIRDQLERISRMSMSAAPPTPSGEAPPQIESEAVELFQTALTQFNLRNYTTARLAFNQLISQYPNSELAPEAQYKLAEILVAQNNLTDALPAFEQVGRLYPTAPKAAEAALQVGLIHLQQGRQRDARQSLQKVVDSYPGTQAAETAQQKLREIPPSR